MRVALLFALSSACTLADASEPGWLVAPTVDDDPGLGAIDVNGTRLHVETHGPPDAPVVIFLHGGPGGDFRYALGLADADAPGALVADHRLVFWDQRGTGLSRRHPRHELSMELYFADLSALIDALSPAAPVVLIGHSWGGAYATWFAAQRPTRVRGLVLIHPQALTRALYREAGDPLPPDLFAEWLADPLWQRTLLSPDDHERADFLLGALELHLIPRFHNDAIAPQFRPGALVFRELSMRWFADTDYDFTAGLAGFTRPVLILAGTDDEILGHAFQRRQQPLFADARLVALPGDGHNDPVMGSARRTIVEIRGYLDGAR